MEETKKNKSLFTENDLILSYSIKQATADGVLFDIRTLNKAWENGIFSHITTNLLSNGYYEKNNEIRIVNLLDLLNQSNQIVKKESKNFTEFDRFFSGKIELPNGRKQQIYIAQNELGKFTIMLPEDN